MQARDTSGPAAEQAPHPPRCPYRRMVDPSGGGGRYYACACAGGVPIGMVGRESADLARVCGTCNLPGEIHLSRRSCLFLVPVRIWEGDVLRTGLSCRWFYNLKPKRLPKEAWRLCLGCPHWVPRRDVEESIPGMAEWMRRVIMLYWEPEAPSLPGGETRCGPAAAEGERGKRPGLWRLIRAAWGGRRRGVAAG